MTADIRAIGQGSFIDSIRDFLGTGLMQAVFQDVGIWLVAELPTMNDLSKKTEHE